jgi:hypothetical protein
MASHPTPVHKAGRQQSNLRRESKRVRRAYTDQIKAVAEEKPLYGLVTNASYLGVLGASADGLRRQRGLGRKATVREHLTDPELAAVMLVEAMAKDHLADGLVNSSDGIALVVFRCGVQVRSMLEAHRARKAQCQTPTAANDQRKQEDAA